MARGVANAHAKSPADILKELNASSFGLTTEQVAARKNEYGQNVISDKNKVSIFLVILRQFNSVMVFILTLAALISFSINHMLDVYVIVFIIFLNAGIGFFQEYKAERAIKALKKMIVQKAKVVRDGDLIQIPASELIPGDIIILEEGDRVPADARIMELKNLRTIESSLTGESFPVDKNLKTLPEKTNFSDQKNMLWLGTFVAAGHAKAIVVSIGENTAIGKLAKSLVSIKQKKTHFKEKTDTLAKFMGWFAFCGALLVTLIGFATGRFSDSVQMFSFALASLISGIPEGLPAVLAIVLAIGAFRMAKRNSIIREKYATETLGIVDTIVSDKTGTITANTMTIQKIALPGQKEITVTGTGWKPEGEFYQENKPCVALENAHLKKLLHIIATCNDSKLIRKQDGGYEIIGDPTEAAMIVVAEKAGLKKSALEQEEQRIDDLPFNQKLKYHASLSVITESNKERQIYVIGAPEAILKNSLHILKNGRKTRPTTEDIKEIYRNVEHLTNKAMRVIAAAYKEIPKNTDELVESQVEELTFVGLVGMTDPPRPEVKSAIEKARMAGIRVIMATGDHKNTALAIAKDIGLVDVHRDSNFPMVLTGAELSEMNDAEFSDAVRNVSVFARLTPEIKLKIAETLQKQGRVVAMTGDGVNDAPALKQADIGISMNIIGTDVAREASSMVLADDNFASIVNAIEEGRIVFINTRQTSFFLATTAFAEYTTIILTFIARLPLPMLPTQILWFNIVTSTVPEIGLAAEKGQNHIIEEKPRDKKENILTKELIPFIFLITCTMLILTLSLFFYHLPDVEKARTAVFAAMSLTELFNMVSLRSLRLPIKKIGYFTNKYANYAFVASLVLLTLSIYTPFLRNLLGFTTLSLFELLVIFVASSSTLWVGEIYKYFMYKNKTGPAEN